MHADLKGTLEQLNTSWKSFEHRGQRMSKNEVRNILEYGIKKGYKTTAELLDSEVDKILGVSICYKSNKICKHECSGLCKNAC